MVWLLYPIAYLGKLILVAWTNSNSSLFPNILSPFSVPLLVVAQSYCDLDIFTLCISYELLCSTKHVNLLVMLNRCSSLHDDHAISTFTHMMPCVCPVCVYMHSKQICNMVGLVSVYSYKGFKVGKHHCLDFVTLLSSCCLKQLGLVTLMLIEIWPTALNPNLLSFVTLFTNITIVWPIDMSTYRTTQPVSWTHTKLYNLL